MIVLIKKGSVIIDFLGNDNFLLVVIDNGGDGGSHLSNLQDEPGDINIIKCVIHRLVVDKVAARIFKETFEWPHQPLLIRHCNLIELFFSPGRVIYGLGYGSY